MAERDAFDVVIVGAGIAGSALAAALSGQGLSIGLVEARPLAPPLLPESREPADFDARVSALTPKSQRFLDDIGAWQGIAGYRLCRYGHMTVWDADGTGSVEFDRSEMNAPALGHIVENRAVVAALLQVIDGAGDVTPLAPATVEQCLRGDDDRMTLVLSTGRNIDTDLVVAADGANSAVRRIMRFNTREWDYGHSGIVTTAEFARSHQDTAWQRFMGSGPLALLPLPGPQDRHLCSIVWSMNQDRVEDILASDDEAFCEALGRASEGVLGEVLAATPRIAFPLRQRHAVDYVQPGVALVGDAAHTIHPLAGQGINLGLADVAALAGEIRRGKDRGVSPGDVGLLGRYQRQRKGDNLLMMAAMDGFKRLFEQDALPVRWLRNAGMRGVGRLGPLKQQLMRHAMGLG